MPFYDYNSGSTVAGQVTGHATQVLWKATTDVGCAYATASARPNCLEMLYVCHYSPPGALRMLPYACSRLHEVWHAGLTGCTTVYPVAWGHLNAGNVGGAQNYRDNVGRPQ
jgi:hypothetical protein